MAARKKQPARGEFDVLRALWELGPSPVRAVREHMEENGRSLAYNTVQTLLNRLVDKGQVRVDDGASTYLYAAAQPQEKVVGARVRGLLDELFDGSAAPLVSHLVRKGGLKRRDFEELSALIEEESKKRRR